MQAPYINMRKSLQELTELYLNGYNIEEYYISCPELGSTFAGKGLNTTITHCTDYVKYPNIEPSLKGYLESFVDMSKQDYSYYCFYFFKFYEKYLLNSDINSSVFLNLFHNKESFKKVNNHMLMKDLKNRLSEIFQFVDENEFFDFYKELKRKDSDYYPGSYSPEYDTKNNVTGKVFSGLPTRVYYGLSMQWEDIDDWERVRGKDIKSSFIPNKDKFEYFINDKKSHSYLSDLANKLNCSIKILVELFKQINNVNNQIEDDIHIQYVLRAFYLWSFLRMYNANIRLNSTGKTFIKIISIKNNTGKYRRTTTEGTFLSEVYDAYNKAQYDKSKKEIYKSKIINPIKKSSKRPKSPTGINNLNSKDSNSVSNNSSSNLGSIRKPNSKFIYESPTYNTNFPNTLLKKQTTKN